ncbi:hypothetical protein GCM10029964_096020 [Kibdelosporangium lantanae]
MRDTVGPAVDAAAAAGGDPTVVTDALVDLAFATHGHPPAGLDRLLPVLARFVAAEPRRVPVAMANALSHVQSVDWVTTMVAVAPDLSTVDELLDVGAVAAWRHGLAVLRTSALAAARRVSPSVLTTVLGTSDVDALAADPWFTGQDLGLRVVRRVGAFRGFGGTFARPPRVFTSHGQWHATDGRDTWRIHADRFGTSIRRVGSVPRDEPTDGLTLSRYGTVQYRGQSLDVPALAGASSWATMGNTLAATTPWTHAITFVAS